MTVRLGLSTYALSWAVGVPGFEQPAQPLTVFDLLAFADELGLRVLQAADNTPLDVLTGTQAQQLYDEAHARGIAIEVGTRGIRTPHLLNYLDIACFFGSPILRVVMDSADHHPTIEEAAELIRAVMPRFEAAGVSLAIENHDRFKAAQLVELIERIDHPRVGICLDTVNSFGALEGPPVIVAALKPYVINLHVKEFVVRRAAHSMGFTVTGAPAGQGMLDMPWLLRELTADGRSFSAIIEAWPAPEATLEETLIKERAWAIESVAYLRTLIPD